LTFPDGYLKIVPNGANPYISNRIDNGFGLVSGSAIQIRQSVADAYGISINSSTTDTSLGDGSLLAGGSNIDVNGSKIILGQYTVNYLDANTGLTGQNKIEINNSAILIGLDVSNITNGTTTTTFSGWTFNGQADTLTFPDSTVQSTAYDPSSIRSEGDINIEINLSDSTLRRWQFGEDGILTAPGAIDAPSIFTNLIDSADSSAITVTPSAIFSSDVTVENNLLVNNITLMTGGGGSTIKEGLAPNLAGGAIILTPAFGANDNQALVIYPTAGEGNHIHLTANGGTTELYLGDDNQYVKLVNGGNVEVRSTTSGSTAAWIFDTEGRLTFPAYPFFVIPEHSYGKAGDTAGMVIIDDTYIYYCTADYVNNSTDIWKRTPHAAGTW